MATDIMGLFGDPYAAQRQQTATFEQNLMQATDPRQFAAVVGTQLGSQLGQGLQGLMGVKTPQQEMQALMRQFDFTTPDGLRQAAKAIQQTNPQAAMALVQKAQEMEYEQSRTGAQNALTTQRQQAKDRSVAAERQRDFVAGLETDVQSGKDISPTDLNKARVALQQMAQPQWRFNTETQTYEKQPGLKPEELAPNLWTKITGVKAGEKGAGGVETAPSASTEKLKREQVQGFQSAVNTIKSDLRNVTEAMGLASGWTVGGFGAFTRAIDFLGLSDASALADRIKSVDSAKIFNQLSALKSQSKTGASGLGQVTKNEFDALGARMTSLNPNNKATFKKDITYIKEKWDELLQRAENDLAYAQGKELPYPNVGSVSAPNDGVSTGSVSPQGTTSPSPLPQVGFNRNQLSLIQQAKRAYPGKTEEEIVNALKNNPASSQYFK